MSDFLKAVEKGINGENVGLRSCLPKFEAFTDGIQKECYVSVGGQQKSGKCLAPGTKVVMYNGTLKSVEDIVVGDLLMGIDSTPRVVKTVTDGEDNMYEIIQSKANSYIVNSAHILSLKHFNGKIKNISVQTCKNNSGQFFRQWHGYKARIEFPETNLDIDPYFFGLWLGDGSKHKPVITTTDTEIIDYLYSFCKDNDYTITNTQKISYYIKDTRKVCKIGDNGVVIEEFISVRDAARSVNKSSSRISAACTKDIKVGGYIWKYKYQDPDRLYNKFKKYLHKDKYIPDEYKYASIAARLQLLAGLIDSDGHLPKEKMNCFEITQKSKGLIDDIVFIANSLGFNTRFKEKNSRMVRTDGSIYRCIVYTVIISGADLDIIPTKILRKKANKTVYCKDSTIKIKSIGFGKYYGFTLDKDGLFLLEDFTVTHNTAFVDAYYVLNAYLQNPGKKIRWLYFTYEISRLKKTQKFAAYFVFIKYGVLKPPTYYLGKQKDDKGNPIKPTKEHLDMYMEVYKNDIIPLCGMYDKNGRILQEGLIDFMEYRIVPTGIKHYITNYFTSIGRLEKTGITYGEVDGVKVEKNTWIYEPNDDTHTIIIVDHAELVAKEKRFDTKQNTDKLSEYFVELRNVFKPTIILVSQFNRELGKIERMKFSREQLKPSASDWKNTGNISADVNQLIGVFNPYSFDHLKDSTYLDYDLGKFPKRGISLHLLESRETEGFVDEMLCFMGECGFIKELPRAEDMTDEVYNKIMNVTFNKNFI